MNVAPASAWRSCIAVSLRGFRRQPASVPSSTGTHGGRAVVGRVCANDEPVAREHRRCEAIMQALPWHGPIVIVVYRLRSSIESNPSVTAVLSSLVVTSMHRHANCLPWPAPTSGGRTTGSSSAPATGAEPFDPLGGVGRCRAERDARPRAPRAALRDRAVERARAGDGAGRVDVRRQLHGQERLRRARRTRARRRSSRAGSSRAPGTRRAPRGRRASFGPPRRPGAPTTTSRTRRRPSAATIVEPAITRSPSTERASGRRSTTVTSAPASRSDRAVS